MTIRRFLPLMLVLLVAACSTANQQLAPTPTPIPRPPEPTRATYIVERGDITTQIQFTGRIRPVVEEELSFRTDGRVRTVYVKRSDFVTEGQLLADLELVVDLERQQRQDELNKRRAEVYLEIAQLQLEAAKQAEDSLEKETRVAILEKEVELAQIALDEVLLGVERRDEEIAKAQIYAPFDGQILSVGLNEGQTVSAFSGGLVLADVDNLEIAATLQSTQIDELSVDMPVNVSPLNRPGEVLQGTIRYLPFQGGENDTGDGFVRISLAQSPQESGLELGDRVQVTIPLESKQDVLWLPPQAIRQFEGRRFVVVRDGDIEQRVDVRIGLQTEDRVEITEGLTEGQVVVGA